MGHVRTLAAGIGIGLVMSACAGVKFPYHFYELLAATYDGGVLVGPQPADDLDFKRCEPTPADQRPCIVMLRTEFANLKLDYLQTKTDLIACQKPK